MEGVQCLLQLCISRIACMFPKQDWRKWYGFGHTTFPLLGFLSFQLTQFCIKLNKVYFTSRPVKFINDTAKARIAHYKQK